MDWQLTCRICLHTGDMISLFDWDENNEQLRAKYTSCCGIEIVKSDVLPTLICLKCVDKLNLAYKFKQQCLTSIETLRECLKEFRNCSAVTNASNAPKETEIITIKQENDVLLQYELPVENTYRSKWDRTVLIPPGTNIISKPKKRQNKPRNVQKIIEVDTMMRKKINEKMESQSITTQLSNSLRKETLYVDIEPDDDEPFGGDFPDDDPDFSPEKESEADQQVMNKKRGRPRKMRDPNVPVKQRKAKPAQDDDDGEDVLLRETILAFSEPIPDHILNPKPKKRKIYKKKKSEKTHTCDTCGASYATNTVLQDHIRRHLGIKPYVCSVCGFACVMKEALKRHMYRHTGEKPYKCRICDRQFADYSTRHKHERLHVGIRPYQCSLCGKSFTYSYTLTSHMVTHTGDKKYSCEICRKKFTKSHHLKTHNKIHHKELYLQQQVEAEAKKAKEIKLTRVRNTDGTLKLIQETSEDCEEDNNKMQVNESHEIAIDENETDRAVTNMQGVVLDEDLCVVMK